MILAERDLKHIIDEMRHFFGVYKQLEGKKMDVLEMSGVEVAKKTIEDNKDLLVLIAEALLKYETITADEIDFLVKYGSLDAYDMYKQNSENLAKGNQAETNQDNSQNNSQEDNSNEN